MTTKKYPSFRVATQYQKGKREFKSVYSLNFLLFFLPFLHSLSLCLLFLSFYSTLNFEKNPSFKTLKIRAIKETVIIFFKVDLYGLLK